MKKLITIAAAFALTLALGTTAFAASPRHNSHHSASSTTSTGYCNFVDADNDGICDNGDTHCSSYLDANNDGICDNCQNQNAHYTHTSTSGHRTGRHGGRHH